MRQFFGGFCIALALGVFSLALVNTAWMSDDAYISFRVADNLLQGYGLRWNIDERVQTFTNPLWVLLNAAAASFNRESWHIYFSGLALSAGVTLAGLLVLGLGVARSAGAGVFALLALAFCRGYVDFSTSGLENPMTHLLLIVFMLPFLRLRWTMPVLFAMSLCAGLSVLNRMDTLLLYAPVLAYAWAAERSWKATFALGAGFLPFAAWEAFSIIYYGFPFPNTAYAKLGSGITSGELLWQGVWYLQNAVYRDPTVPLLLVLGLLVAPWVLRQGKYFALALGGVLYVVYVVKVGGDFMQGRFLTAPLLVAVLLLVRLPRVPVVAWGVATLVAIGLSLWAPNVPVNADDDYADGQKRYMDAHLVGDERKFYMQGTGWRWWNGVSMYPNQKWALEAQAVGAQRKFASYIHGAVGFTAFFKTPKAHVIDYHALADPLLARLPAQCVPEWRIGHFARVVPKWYLGMMKEMSGKLQEAFPEANAMPTLAEIEASGIAPRVPVELGLAENDKNRFHGDGDLMAYYEKLSLIIRGPLWSLDRWKAIVNMNLGRYDHLIHRDLYIFPGMERRKLEEVATPRAVGARAAEREHVVMKEGGLEVALGAVTHAGRLEFSADHRARYRVLFFRDGESVAWTEVALHAPPKGDMQVAELAVPVKAIRAGYDAVRFVPFVRNRAWLGHLKLL